MKDIFYFSRGHDKKQIMSADDVRLLHEVKRVLCSGKVVPGDIYLPNSKIDAVSVDFRTAAQVDLLEVFQQRQYQELFERLRNNSEINTGFNGQSFVGRGLIHNGYYPTPDAEIYAAMIIKYMPKRIIEVGSGFSTLIARLSLGHVGGDAWLWVIDPEPRRDVKDFADRVDLCPVEVSSLSASSLRAGDLLFIDSSHVCRRGGDVPFLYCGVLPALPPGVLVHVHDVFLPYDYPDAYVSRFYTEQYLLQALLANSLKFDVVFATHYMTRECAPVMQKVFGPDVGEDELFYGASFWMMSKS